MNGDLQLSIGELARRTGLPVRTIRFYSDRGIVPPTGRDPAGHRHYDTAALARLELVRTLRDLGIDLQTIRQVVERQALLGEVVAAHAEALAVRIRVLRLRRAVLTAVARHGSRPEEIELMHQLARLSEQERAALTEAFLGDVFGGLSTGPGFDGIQQTLTPVLPDDPDEAQVEAWIELAGLLQDEGFRSALRQTAEQHAAHAGAGPRRDIVSVVRDQACPALAAGLDPTAAEADPVIARVVDWYAQSTGGDQALRSRLASANDHRRDRYLHLLAIVNGWPAPEPQTPALDWFVRALDSRGS